MFYRLGSFSYRYRWPIIGFWLALFLLGLFFAPRVSRVLREVSYDVEQGEAVQARKALGRELGWPRSQVTAVFTSPLLTADDPVFRQELEATLDRLASLPKVTGTTSFLNSANPRLVSPDRHTTFVDVALDGSTDEVLPLLPEIKDRLQTPSLEVYLTGGPAIHADAVAASERDLRRAEAISLPLVLIALLVIFGTLVAAGAPLVVGGVSVVVALTVLYFLAQGMAISVFTMNMVTMLGLGIAIDYSLFLVSRFREELGNGSREEAVARTVATAGRAVFFSGATTFLGLSGLMTFDFVVLRSLGIGGALVVAVSVLTTLTLLPAVLGVVGPKVNSLRIVPRRKGRGGFWHAVASRVMRYPVFFLLGVLAFLLFLGSPFVGAELGMPDHAIIPRDMESRKGFELLVQQFGGGELYPLYIAAQTEGSVLQADNVGRLYDFTRELAQDPRVARVDSLTTLDPRLTRELYQQLYAQPRTILPAPLQEALARFGSGQLTLVRVVMTPSHLSPQARSLVNEIRGMAVPGLAIQIGGFAAESVDYAAFLYGQFPRALILIVVTIYVALAILFRSLVLPAKAVLMNALSLLASYGALVFIFQQGHLSRLLNFTPQGFVEASLPILIFCILFGLSMDYEVFLLSRIKEVYDATGDNTHSVALGLERTGGIITSAALVMVLVTGSFASSDTLVIKALGLGIAIAVFLDATVVRALLVPATMRLLGRWNWWAPRPLGVSRRTAREG